MHKGPDGVDKKRKVVFCVPSLFGPTKHHIESMKRAIPIIVAAGWEEQYVQEIGNPYISGARAAMTRKALDAHADVIVYLDYDLSFEPEDLLALIESDGEVVAGTYRFKVNGDERYMGVICDDEDNLPVTRADGCIQATRVPAGFLKVTAGAIGKFMAAYPELIYGPAYSPSIDLFHHGAHKGAYWGEDYAFSRNWIDAGGEIWLLPNINLNHHSSTTEYPGNFHEFLMRQPGGSKAPA